MSTKTIRIKAGGYHGAGTLTQTGNMHRATLEMKEKDDQGQPVVVPFDTGNHNMEGGARTAIMRWLEDRYGDSAGQIQLAFT